jgi:gliding motility-associatede transport system auxiliary component
MASLPPDPPSYSRRRRWSIGLDVVVRTILVGAVVVMANYLGAQFFHRFYLSAQTRVQLSQRTLSVLQSLTNRVAVTLYYDRKDDFYPDIVGLLTEYQKANSKISVRTVDPVREPGEAEKAKEQYGLGAGADKNLIIFDAGGKHVKIANGDALIQYEPQGMSKDKKIEFGPVAFRGEMMFTATLLALENARPFKAYFLQGDGEPSLADTGNFGYMTFGMVLAQHFIATTNLELSGARDVPGDCNLLIIAAPTVPLAEPELQKINQYLAQGGRLLALFNYRSIKQPTGLEPILQRWGLNVSFDYVQDPQHTITGDDLRITSYGKHPIVESLAGNDLSLQMILPRPISPTDRQPPPPDAPEVTELAFSSADSTLAGDPSAAPRGYPLMAAVEQKNAAGVVNPRGATRIVVAGDSIFLGNYYIQGGGNRDFLGYAANWLLDRPQLLEGIGPRPVTEFRLQMTRRQQREVRWLLLGALPGAVMLLGGLVWLARRK